MDERTPGAAETETLREVYAALDRKEIPAAVQLLDPQIEWIEPTEYRLGGTFRGHAALQAHMIEARDTWAEGTCAPERFIVAGDKVIVFLKVHVRLKRGPDWIDGEIADVFTFRNGKAIQMKHFGEREDALAWVGVKDPEAG